MNTLITLARCFFGLAFTLITLLCVSLFAYGVSSSLGETTELPRTRIVAIATFGVFSVISALVSWGLLKRRANVSSGSSHHYEKWESAEGQVFSRPWKSAIPLIIISPLVISLWLIALIAFLAMVSTIGEKSFADSMELILFSGIFLFCASMPMHVLWKLLQLRGSPLAIVGRDGITMPRSKPGYVPWDNVTEIMPVRVGKGIFLEIRLAVPSKIFNKPRRWWHGPWRKDVMVGIGSMRHPLIAAAKQAKEDAHSRLGCRINFP
jgi:hypothetical protein